MDKLSKRDIIKITLAISGAAIAGAFVGSSLAKLSTTMMQIELQETINHQKELMIELSDSIAYVDDVLSGVK
jgi:hypothetical protein